MVTYFTFGLLFGFFTLPGVLLGDLVFRCPSCTAEDLYACPKVSPGCMEVVRESGCGCCPVCARLEGEPCGVYSPRCSTGLRCYPSVDAEFPLQELIQGSGQCRQRLDLDVTTSVHWQPTYEVHETESPPTRRPLLDARFWQELARKQHQNELKAKMKEDRMQREPQCNMSTHGQRGECWCVNPLTGLQLPETPKIRGDPNCNQFQEEHWATPTTTSR
ncbi:insulin-like growth factor-binding protein 2-A isoform X2 [Kryptolebias marmoratus]|uniref:insulin-like growth factor-binding protein 2-A isoform X2 n=1 Tax=Kryptolebias marmoratus TaxID=37003 RepID=UPI0007F893A1|nr:insulin-like growth factor-binding protein 2-A isoform X2 [Kryptolebias marmoratus]